MARTERQRRGEAAEATARRHLERAGLRTLARNWHCRAGELDLIMADADTVVFVEVRHRRGTGFGGALGSIDRRKRQRIARAAQAWLQRQPGEPAARFDVVVVDADGNIDWRAGAFDLD